MSSVVSDETQKIQGKLDTLAEKLGKLGNIEGKDAFSDNLTEQTSSFIRKMQAGQDVWQQKGVALASSIQRRYLAGPNGWIEKTKRKIQDLVQQDQVEAATTDYSTYTKSVYLQAYNDAANQTLTIMGHEPQKILKNTVNTAADQLLAMARPEESALELLIRFESMDTIAILDAIDFDGIFKRAGITVPAEVASFLGLEGTGAGEGADGEKDGKGGLLGSLFGGKGDSKGTGDGKGGVLATITKKNPHELITRVLDDDRVVGKAQEVFGHVGKALDKVSEVAGNNVLAQIVNNAMPSTGPRLALDGATAGGALMEHVENLDVDHCFETAEQTYADLMDPEKRAVLVNKLLDSALDMLMLLLPKIHIDNLEGETEDGAITYGVGNIDLGGYKILGNHKVILNINMIEDAQKFAKKLRRGGWELISFKAWGMSCKLDDLKFKYEQQTFPYLNGDGIACAHAKDVSLELGFGLRWKHGKPQLLLSRRAVDMGDLQLEIQESFFSWIYNILATAFASLIKAYVIGKIEDQIDDNVLLVVGSVDQFLSHEMVKPWLAKIEEYMVIDDSDDEKVRLERLDKKKKRSSAGSGKSPKRRSSAGSMSSMGSSPKDVLRKKRKEAKKQWDEEEKKEAAQMEKEIQKNKKERERKKREKKEKEAGVLRGKGEEEKKKSGSPKNKKKGEKGAKSPGSKAKAGQPPPPPPKSDSDRSFMGDSPEKKKRETGGAAGVSTTTSSGEERRGGGDSTTPSGGNMSGTSPTGSGTVATSSGLGSGADRDGEDEDDEDEDDASEDSYQSEDSDEDHLAGIVPAKRGGIERHDGLLGDAIRGLKKFGNKQSSPDKTPIKSSPQLDASTKQQMDDAYYAFNPNARVRSKSKSSDTSKQSAGEGASIQGMHQLSEALEQITVIRKTITNLKSNDNVGRHQAQQVLCQALYVVESEGVKDWINDIHGQLIEAEMQAEIQTRMEKQQESEKKSFGGSLMGFFGSPSDPRNANSPDKRANGGVNDFLGGAGNGAANGGAGGGRLGSSSSGSGPGQQAGGKMGKMVTQTERREILSALSLVLAPPKVQKLMITVRKYNKKIQSSSEKGNNPNFGKTPRSDKEKGNGSGSDKERRDSLASFSSDLGDSDDKKVTPAKGEKKPKFDIFSDKSFEICSKLVVEWAKLNGKISKEIADKMESVTNTAQDGDASPTAREFPRKLMQEKTELMVSQDALLRIQNDLEESGAFENRKQIDMVLLHLFDAMRCNLDCNDLFFQIGESRRRRSERVRSKRPAPPPAQMVQEFD